MASHEIEERGILTDRDIQFLKGEKEYENDEQRSRARKEIRERVAAAMDDFSILIEHLPQKQWEKTIDLVEKQEGDGLEDLGADIVTFLYILENFENSDPNIIREDDPIEKLLRFRRSLNNGIRGGKEYFGGSPGTVCTAATVHLYEEPSPEEVQREIDSEILNDLASKMEKKISDSAAYDEDDDNLPGDDILEKYQNAVKGLEAEWYNEVGNKVKDRRWEADDFRYGLDQPRISTSGYRDEFRKSPKWEE